MISKKVGQPDFVVPLVTGKVCPVPRVQTCPPHVIAFGSTKRRDQAPRPAQIRRAFSMSVFEIRVVEVLSGGETREEDCVAKYCEPHGRFTTESTRPTMTSEDYLPSQNLRHLRHLHFSASSGLQKATGPEG